MNDNIKTISKKKGMHLEGWWIMVCIYVTNINYMWSNISIQSES